MERGCPAPRTHRSSLGGGQALVRLPRLLPDAARHLQGIAERHEAGFADAEPERKEERRASAAPRRANGGLPARAGPVTQPLTGGCGAAGRCRSRRRGCSAGCGRRPACGGAWAAWRARPRSSPATRTAGKLRHRQPLVTSRPRRSVGRCPAPLPHRGSKTVGAEPGRRSRPPPGQSRRAVARRWPMGGGLGFAPLEPCGNGRGASLHPLPYPAVGKPPPPPSYIHI